MVTESRERVDTKLCQCDTRRSRRPNR